MEKALYACDEVTGLITAVALGPSFPLPARPGAVVSQKEMERQGLCRRRQPGGDPKSCSRVWD